MYVLSKKIPSSKDFSRSVVDCVSRTNLRNELVYKRKEEERKKKKKKSYCFS